MVIVALKHPSFMNPSCLSFLLFSSVRWLSMLKPREESIRSAVEAKSYEQIPDLLTSSKQSRMNPNPFFFLSAFPLNERNYKVDEMLQSFSSLRPHYHPRIAYSYLLSYILQSSNPLPLALAVLQRTLRSGCLPVPQTHLLLSTAWLERRSQSQSVSNILLEMQSIEYNPDCGICNYLILSLCKVDHFKEAAKVLKGMGGAGCIPDLDSFGTLIGEMCDHRMTFDVVEMVKEMVKKFGLHPRQEIVVKVAAAIRADKDLWKAVEMIEFLESEDVHVGFDCYEFVLKGCLECCQFVLAGKLVMRMTERGFIPYIRTRQRVMEGLASVGEWEIASAVRQSLADLNS